MTIGIFIMFENLKTIKKRTGSLVSTAVIYTLYLELSSIFPFRMVAKLIRKCFLQPVLCLQILPSSFTKESLLTLRIVHPYMIIIHGTAQIGKNCTLYHEVTIGNIEHHSLTAPIIKDNVYIGCKSACLGSIVIEDNITIGAGSIVLASTSKNSRVYGLYKRTI